MNTTYDYLIIGGGVIGCAIATELARRGERNILIIDMGRPGHGSSAKAAGGLRAQFSTEFTIRCTLLSQHVFRNTEEYLGGSIDYVESGYIILGRTDEQVAAFTNNVALQQSLGVDVNLITPDDVERAWPWIRTDDLQIATWCPTDAIFDQVKYADLMVKQAVDAGVEVRGGVEAVGFVHEGGRVHGVRTTEGTLLAGTTIMATGAWSARLGATIGLDIPVTPLRRTIYTTPQVAGLPEIVPFVADFDRGQYLKRDGDTVMLSGSRSEDMPWDETFDVSRGATDTAWAPSVFPSLHGAQITGGWSGLIELTPDQHPLLGRPRGIDGLVMAVGFSGHGVMHAPIAGVLMGEYILDGKATTLDIEPLNPDRFADAKPLTTVALERRGEQGDVGMRPAQP